MAIEKKTLNRKAKGRKIKKTSPKGKKIKAKERR